MKFSFNELHSKCHLGCHFEWNGDGGFCYGNICRSPMAEFVFKDMVAKVGLSPSFEIASAATSRVRSDFREAVVLRPLFCIVMHPEEAAGGRL